MSIKFFEIRIPVRAREIDRIEGRDAIDFENDELVVTITMGPDATVEDAVGEFEQKLEEACKTIGTGDET